MGLVFASFHRRVGQQNSYRAYSEWQNMETFEKLIISKEFSDVKAEGPHYLVAKPYHKIYSR